MFNFNENKRSKKKQQYIFTDNTFFENLKVVKFDTQS